MEENIFFRKFKERFDCKENSGNFDFSKFIWNGWNAKSTVICKEHGEFIKTAQKHLSGQGCPECSIMDVKRRGELPGFYTEKSLLSNPEMANRPSILYYVKVGGFYKIGVTSDLKSRIRVMNSLFGLNIELIDSINITFIDGIRLESKILKKYSKFQVVDSGFKTTELFSKDVLNGKIEIDRI